MSTTAQEYEWFQVDGPISIIPVTPKGLENEALWIYILLGATGSGKSSFIESLSPDQHLNLSKNSLESVTQEVNCYQVANLSINPGRTQGSDIDLRAVLMDTPGFLDPRLSEGRIMRMITERLDAFRRYAKGFMVFILYFQPITDIRIGGSKRHSFKVLKEYVDLYQAHDITVITTMWNTLSTPRQLKDAKERFESLKKEIYASSDGLDIRVTKLDTSSKDSALSSLITVYYGWTDINGNSNDVIGSLFQGVLRDNLLSRISTTLQQLQLIAEDKRSATSPGSEDHCLLDVVLRDELVALASLQSFVDDLVCYGPAGMIALQSLLDTRYDQDPGACSSRWPLSRASALASAIPVPAGTALQPMICSNIPSDPAPTVPLPVAVAPSPNRLGITTLPTPSTPQPLPHTSRFASLIASFKRQFNLTRR